MPSRFTHKNHYIDVNIIRRNSYGSQSFALKVFVGPEGGNPEAFIGTGAEFTDEKAAETCGFALGREWIDVKKTV